MSNPGMWLEIRRGKTNFPLRPISGDRFLIGAGSHCHLQLGGDDVPMLHSLLVIDGKRALLEAVVSAPPLLVNGEACRMVELADEDTVSIGDFEFVFHQLVASEPVSQAALAGRSETGEVAGVAELSRLSAAELIDLIEDEARQIHEYNRNRESGAVALLDAARRSHAPAHPISVPMAAFTRETMPETESVVSRTQSFSLTQREDECLRRAAQLQDAQQLLAAQMAEFAKMVACWQESETGMTRRVSA